MVPLQELPDELARFDINTAPLELGNPFCEAKSELKYFEAALAGVCTVASPTGPMRRAIRDGETGLLAGTEEEWYQALTRLVDEPAVQRRIGHAAYLDVLWSYSAGRRTELVHGLQAASKRLGRAASTISRKLRRNAARRRAERWPRVSRDHGAMARGASGSPAQAGEACVQRGVTNLCGGTTGWRCCRRKRSCSSQPGRVLDRPPAWAAARPAMGKGLEPRADRPSPAGRLPERDETMRISHEAIYQALFVQGRGALRRELTACLRIGRALRTPRARTKRNVNSLR